jgi:hypothetical protein
VVIFLAPFPRILRYLIATSFFFVYQYAVVARSYVLLPLLAFGSAWLFRKGTRAVIPLALTLSLLVHVSLHGAVIAVALAVAFAVDLRPQWSGLDSIQRKRAKIAAAIFVFALAMLVITVFPAQSKTYVVADAQAFPFWVRVAKMFSFLFLGLSDSNIVGVIIFVGIIILPLVFLWLLERRGALLSLIAVGSNAIIYGFLRGAQHHRGILLIALLTAVWTVWPTKTELETAPKKFLSLHRAMVTVLSLLFAWQSYWSVVAIRNDWSGAYSGAKDAAMYMRSIHAETAGCNGYDLRSVGVQPYFAHNIFANFGGPDAPAYFHPTQDVEESVAGIPAFMSRRTNPPCVLIAAGIDSTQDVDKFLRIMEAQGYELVHTSEGSAFFGVETGELQLYWFFVRRPGVPVLRAQSSVQHP